MSIIQKIVKIQNSKHKRLLDIVLILIGTFLLATSVNMIYDPMKLVMGGFGGLSIIVKDVAGRYGVIIPVWLTNALLNIPLFIIAFFLLGKEFVAITFLGDVSFALWLYIIPGVDICKGDYLLAIVFGGLLEGFGIGSILLSNSTSGGTDMVSAVLHKFLKHYSVPNILLFVDGLIVILGAFTLGLRNAMYGVIAIYILTKVSDAILEGVKFAKMIYIISDEYEAIASSIMNTMDRGVTGLSAKGMYTDKSKNMLFCVVNKKEIVGIKEIVATIDPKAFVIVNDVREVFGEGFIEYKQNSAVR